MVKGNLIPESPLDLTMVSIADVTGSFWGSPFNEHPERNSSVKMSRWFFDKDTEKSSHVGCIDIKKESCNNSLSKPPLYYFHVYGCYYQVPCEPRFFCATQITLALCKLSGSDTLYHHFLLR